MIWNYKKLYFNTDVIYSSAPLGKVHSQPTFKVLLEADLSTFFESKESENAFRQKQAHLFWINNFEVSRQWLTALGKSKEIYSQAWFQNHLQGGIQRILQD
jgi:hypothetical protein